MSRLRGFDLLFKVGGDGVPGLMRQQGGPQERQLLVGLEPPESLGGFHHAGGRPTQGHLGILPSFDVAADAADGAVHVLDDVGAGKRTAQPGRKAEAGDGEDFVDAFQDAAGDAGGLGFKASGQIADQSFRLRRVAQLPRLTQLCLLNTTSGNIDDEVRRESAAR